MKKNEIEKCANCGADRSPGSTLCCDCIITCGGSEHLPGPDDVIIMEMFRGPKKTAEIDVTGWPAADITEQIKIQVILQKRNIKISGRQPVDIKENLSYPQNKDNKFTLSELLNDVG